MSEAAWHEQWMEKLRRHMLARRTRPEDAVSSIADFNK